MSARPLSSKASQKLTRQVDAVIATSFKRAQSYSAAKILAEKAKLLAAAGKLYEEAGLAALSWVVICNRAGRLGLPSWPRLHSGNIKDVRGEQVERVVKKMFHKKAPEVVRLGQRVRLITPAQVAELGQKLQAREAVVLRHLRALGFASPRITKEIDALIRKFFNEAGQCQTREDLFSRRIKLLDEIAVIRQSIGRQRMSWTNVLTYAKRLEPRPPYLPHLPSVFAESQTSSSRLSTENHWHP